MKVILAPVISEKATMVGEQRRQVVFEVLPDATKAEIKAAVELLFKDQKVEVGAVNVVNVKGKEKRHGRFIGRRKGIKKAYVSLKGEGDINFVEGVA
jgi:large subunit ribosomal protein L23